MRARLGHLHATIPSPTSCPDMLVPHHLLPCEFSDILIGLLRLRKCSKDTFRPELKGGVSIVRELHVYPSL